MAVDVGGFKRLLLLLCAVAAPFAGVVGGALALSAHFGAASEARADAVAKPAASAAPAPTVAPAPAAAHTAAAALNPADVINQRFARDVQPFLAQHCYNCHGQGKKKGELDLEPFKTLTAVQNDPNTWRAVSDMIVHKVMPPDNRPQPSPESVQTVALWIRDALAFYDRSAPRDPGFVAIRRLNRAEYNNTIRDLLGVDFRPADDFPADDTGYGFDNIADVLTTSPLLVEKYLAAAEQVLDKAVVTKNPHEPRVVRFSGTDLTAVGDGNVGGELGRNGEAFQTYEAVTDATYTIRVKAAQQKFGDEPARMVLRVDGQDAATFDVKNQRGDQKAYEVTVDLNRGPHRIAAAYVNNAKDENNRDRKKRGDRNLYVTSIEVNGPLYAPPPAYPEPHKRIFFKSPGNGLSDDDCARQLIEKFAGRAFRRPVASDEVEELLKLYRLARGEGDNFEQGVKLALTGVLVSPHFLFRVERDADSNPDAPHPVSDFELATRLSYFLWSSTPDDKLLADAAAGRLRDPAVLAAQTKRMLADPKAAALVSNFAGQWLELRNLDRVTPDPGKFPSFDAKLRASMRREGEMFFEHLVREDRSVLDLLNADYTFLDERLAKHYGIGGVKGDDFRRVTLTDPRRGGVLTMAAVLTVTATPTRTSPVMRGKFVLEQILGTPPPPAPAEVPSLSEKPQDVTAASLKKRLEQHREDPSCAVCHVRMDPIGFSLENFDAIGAWRDRDGEFPIDPTGSLPEGQALNGPESLRRVLMEQKDEFVKCLAEKMLTYAVGRGPRHYDRITVKDACDAAARDGYKLSTLVTSIVTSDTFQKRRAKRGDE